MIPSRTSIRAVVSGAVALLGLLVPATSEAQGGLVLRARGLAGFTHERPESLGSEHDVWGSAIPGLSLLVVEPRWLLRATYDVTATLHTRNPYELGQRMTVASSYELSPRLLFLAGAEANQSTLSTYLVTRPVDATALGALPVTNTQLFSATAREGLAWEASPVVLVGQSADAAFVKSFTDATRLTSVFANAVASVDRLWENDALGAELRGGFARTDAAPLPVATYYAVTAAPRWRHDWTETLGHAVSGGATAVLSPDRRSEAKVLPFGRASFLYTRDTTSVELAYAGGVAPNLLTGQLLRSHGVTLRGATPLSERGHVTLAASAGYLRGRTLVVDERIASPPAFDALLSDVDLSWLATDYLTVFGRYQFLGQFGGPGSSLLRESFVVGVQVTSQPPDGVRIATRFAQRVDGSDAAPRP